MQKPPFIPDSAPFTAEQRGWLNGFLAGLYSTAPASPFADPPPSLKIAVLYASQSGTAEGLARKVTKDLKAKGHIASLISLEGYTPAALLAERYAIFIASTYARVTRQMPSALSTSNSASSTSPAAENSLTLSSRSATPATSTSANSARTSTTNSLLSAAFASQNALTATSTSTSPSPNGRQLSTSALTKWPPLVPSALHLLLLSPRGSTPPL